MAVIEMSVQDWIKIPDNPRQRNTERRANFAKTKHLSHYAKPHRFVFAAVRDGNIICKLDAHTRALLWETGELDAPPDGNVTVCLIEVVDMKEAKYLYDCLDAPGAVKLPSDFIFGATRENKFKLRSALLRKCSFATQLKLAESGKNFKGDSATLVRKWKTELIALDSLGLTSNYTILISSMLVTIKRDGLEISSEFWQGLDQGKGTKTNAGMDGIEALNQNILVRRAEKRMSGYENLIDILGRSVTAYEAWKNGRRVKSLRASDFSQWLGGKNVTAIEEGVQ